MTQIKNINAMQELTEVQEDMADTHDKFHNKSLKGKKGYITFARTKEGMFICGDGESSVIKGIQARVLVGKEVLADCYWTEKEGINLCPIRLVPTPMMKTIKSLAAFLFRVGQ